MTPQSRFRRGVLHRLAAAGLLLALMAGLEGCSVNPATGQQSFTAFMSPADEQRVGKQQDPLIREQLGGRYDHGPLGDYVTRVGEALAAHAELPDLNFTFTVLNTPDVNAFALPGGYIYVTRGLVALADSEAQLAGVLAHEIGHVTARHAAQRYSWASIAQFGELLLRSSDLKGLGDAFGIGGQLFLSGYSREQEFEADTLGIRYLAKAGYDPRGVPQFLAKLREHAKLEAARSGTGQDPDQFQLLGTHPRTIDRVDRAMEAARVAPDQGGRVGTEAYLRRIDGILHGPDPAKGEIRGTTFIKHVDGYRFSIPEGARMRLVNDRLLIQGPGPAQATVDTAPITVGLAPDRYISGVWAARTPLSGLEPLTINGLPAATAAVDIRTDKGTASLRLIAARLRADRVVRFAILMPHPAPASVSVALRRMTYSLETFSPGAPGTLAAPRLAVHRVQPGETAASLARRLPDRPDREREFRVLNGLGPAEEPSAGTLVKLISG
jgi:predicted Zn-dependent protease